MQPSLSKSPVFIAAVGAAGAFSFWIGGQTVLHENRTSGHQAVPASVESDQIQRFTLSAALDEGIVKVALRGNGRDRMKIAIGNCSDRPIDIEIPAGQFFRSTGSTVVLLRTREFTVEKKSVLRSVLETAAVHAGGPVGETTFKLSGDRMPKLDAFLDYLAQHPELTTAAAQTAVLALTDNLPVGAFAKFTPVGGNMPSILDTSAFRVDVADILKALLALRDLGVPASQIALAVDPQLRIEAMIDPLAHAMAMSYYRIAPEREWEYWRWELRQGNEATRHYALFGIARFFPDVAVAMLPKWVREPRTNPVYRLSALQALAETDRPEVLGILKQLAFELRDDVELGRTAMKAVQYVSERAGRASGNSKVAVAFRIGGTQM